MPPRKVFENWLTIMAILVLFEQFLGKFCLHFWPLSLSALPNIMHFVGTETIMRASGDSRHIVTKRFKITETFYSSKALLKITGEGGSIPHIPLGPSL